MDSTAPKEAGPAVGIDLGTTFSCVAVMTSEKIEIIPNEQGNNTMPSYVAFNKDQRLIGEAAKSQESRNTKNTVFDAKRLIGNTFSNEQVKKDMKHWGFKVKAGENDAPIIQVEVNGEQKDFQPEEISSMVLQKMAKIAEDYLQKSITKAVVTVPAYFNDSQRQATKDAGAIAGLEVLRIINEPTAAAIAYGLDKAGDKETSVLIFDLGGGTFDVSILTIEDGVFAVKATNGDTHLGGNDFDNLMVDHCIKVFKDKHKIDLSKNDRAKAKLSQACEKAKRILSTATQTLIEVEAIAEDTDFELNFSRSLFEELCQSVFDRAFAPVTAVMKDSGMTKDKINEVVLVGGSTRIPKIQSMLSEFFSGKTLNKSIHPDEAVAYGAAVQAAILTGQQTDAAQDIVLLDVTPLSLGIELKGGLMDTIIPRNSTIPKRATKTYTTVVDGQTKINSDVFQGERAMAQDNHCIAKSMVEGITPAKAGDAKIKVTFDIDANGILNVFACEQGNEEKTQMHMTVNTDKSRLSSDQVKKMQEEADKFKAEDEAHIKRVNKRNEVEMGLNQIREWLREDEERGRFSKDEAELLAEVYGRGMEWLDANPRATFQELREAQERADDKMRTVAIKYNLFIQRGGPRYHAEDSD